MHPIPGLAIVTPSTQSAALNNIGGIGGGTRQLKKTSEPATPAPIPAEIDQICPSAPTRSLSSSVPKFVVPRRTLLPNDGKSGVLALPPVGVPSPTPAPAP